LGDHYETKGNHLAFGPTRYNKSQFRISDITISKWNGMKDSAQSMSDSKRDIILLNNGMDRFSGKFQSISNGQVHFKGTFDNDLTIPLDQVQEIHFATNRQTKPPVQSKDAVYFFIYPHGRITGIPYTEPDAPANSIRLKTSLFGDLPLDTRYINIIDFSHKNSLLELWDDNF
jgi:hypothetical protein